MRVLTWDGDVLEGDWISTTRPLSNNPELCPNSEVNVIKWRTWFAPAPHQLQLRHFDSAPNVVCG
jgi:hypothetical protein